MKKRILLTGSSGFMGKLIYDSLDKSKFDIIKLSRSGESGIKIDISNQAPQEMEVDYVIHLAGKAHFIPRSEEEKKEFYKVNYIGTGNLLSALKAAKLKSIIFFSTVAVYGKDEGILITEDHDLLGKSPYALSKIQAEKLIIDYGKKNKIKTIVLRLPLIIGENPKGNLGSMINAIKNNYYFRIGQGEARKSIIAASDICRLIPELIELDGIYNLTDTYHPKISEIEMAIASKYNKKLFSIPEFIAKPLSKLGDKFSFIPFNSSRLEKLTKNLTFSNEKIIKHLTYKPCKGLKEL